MAPMMELRPPRRWRMLARSELRSMKTAVSALPLAERLRRSVADFKRCKKMLILVPSSGPHKEVEAAILDSGLAEFLEHIDEYRKGGSIHLDARGVSPLPPESFMAGLTGFRYEGKGDATLEEVDDIICQVKRWREGRVAFIRKELDRFRVDAGIICDGKLNGFVGYRSTIILLKDFKKNADRAAIRLINAAATIALIKSLGEAIGNEGMNALSELISQGSDRVKGYVKLEREKKRALPFEKTLAKKKYSLACPKALAALREQWMREEKEAYGMFYKAEHEDILPAPEQKKRSEWEDIEILNRDFPGLYRKMMRPTARELKLRAMKNLARRMRREGLSYEEISKRLEAESGAMDPEAGIPRRIRRGWTPERRQEPGPEGRADGVNRSREEFIASVRLSRAAERAIRDYDLNPTDVVFMLFKGFDLGKTFSAVGGKHYRGGYIKRNIRRYLRKAYKEKQGESPTTKKLLAFLRSVDLIIDAGGSARTKDEAMSINTSPNHPIGQDILTTINAAVHELRTSTT